jgi:hypothetical protein
MRPNGVDTATALYRGSAFMVQGQVTSMQMDGQGHPQAIVVDGTYPIAVAQATFNGMSPGAMGSGMGGDMSGGMGSGGMMSGGMGRGMGGGGMMGDPGNPLLLQEGSTVALGGIVENGLYAAVFAHVMASSMQWTGTIHSMTYDKSNNVIGFVMNRSGSGTVVMDAHTRISMHGQGMGGGGSLRIGMQVAVSGLSRHDGSMLAQAVQVQAGHM